MSTARDSKTRIAIVSGLRTPFQKQSTGFQDQTPLMLAAALVRELLRRNEAVKSSIEQIVFGQVLPTIAAPNIARELVFAADLPRSIDAYSVSRACATSYQATVNLAQAIECGHVDAGIAGGVDSASVLPFTASDNLAKSLLRLSKSRTFADRVGALSSLGIADLKPNPPAIAEFSTGLSMGESAEKMAKENGISRDAQDDFAHQSHVHAAAAWQRGFFSNLVMDWPDHEKSLDDNVVRRTSARESYARLSPAFDRKNGSVTAGNSSPLTDGASAMVLMREDKAQAQGLTPLGFLRSHAFAAIDPRGQLLMGPAYAVPRALARAGLPLAEIGVFDMHEAFAAQVLSNTQALQSDAFAQKQLGQSKRVGEIRFDSFNPTGGSISLGHPFAATGTRQIMQTLASMRERDVQFGLCTACAAGGLGAAIVLERG